MPGSPPASSATTTPWPRNPGQAAGSPQAARPREHPRPFPPRGSEPAKTSRTTSPETQGSSPGPARGPSPARLNAVGTPSPLELRRAQEPRAASAPRRTHARLRKPGRPPACPQPGPPPDQPRHLGKHRQVAAKPLRSTTEITSRNHLTNLPLRWFPRKRLVKICTMRFRGNAAPVAASIVTSVWRSVCGR